MNLYDAEFVNICGVLVKQFFIQPSNLLAYTYSHTFRLLFTLQCEFTCYFWLQVFLLLGKRKRGTLGVTGLWKDLQLEEFGLFFKTVSLAWPKPKAFFKNVCNHLAVCSFTQQTFFECLAVCPAETCSTFCFRLTLVSHSLISCTIFILHCVRLLVTVQLPFRTSK